MPDWQRDPGSRATARLHRCGRRSLQYFSRPVKVGACIERPVLQRHLPLRRYYRFLTALENTIPVGKERGGAALRFQVRGGAALQLLASGCAAMSPGCSDNENPPFTPCCVASLAGSCSLYVRAAAKCW